jgi:mannose-1-phosphate guanylyltransferase
MFLWRAEIILKAFDAFMPEMKKAWDESGGDIERAYPKMTATSIDYGIMEKAKNVVTFPLDCGWDDVGSWTSLEGLAQVLGARHGTNTVTAGELVTVDSDGHIVDAPGKLVAILGVNDLIVVEAGDSILVAHKDRAQDIKQVVELVKQKRPDLA